MKKKRQVSLSKNNSSPKAKTKSSSRDNTYDKLYSSEKTPLRLYLNDISKYPLLTPEEEHDLAIKVRKGNKAAREKMIRSNLRLVVKIANDYNNLGLSYLDLISEGNIGLMKAIDRFDPDRGGKLCTYAAWWIKQSIKRALANQGKTIRLPVHLIEKVSRMRRIETELKMTLKREPSVEEIARAINLPPNKVALMKSVSIKPASLDHKVGKEENTCLGELIGDESMPTPSDNLENKTVVKDLKSLINHLDPRDAKIISMRFGINGQRPKTLEEVGVTLGITRERVRQLQTLILRQLRELVQDQERQRSEDEIKVEKLEISKAKVFKEFVESQNEKAELDHN